jgi:hypothetical protein
LFAATATESSILEVGGDYMDVMEPNKIKLPLDEKINEVIQIVKPTHEHESCSFLEGPLWAVRKTFYNDKLANRVYHLVNHHLYAVYRMKGAVETVTYLKVSGRGNINEVTLEDAIDAVKKRKGYIDDFELMNEIFESTAENPDPSIPYNVNQDG